MPKSYEAFRVKATLPNELLALQDLAYNLCWTWNQDTIELFRRLDRSLWEATKHNPVKMLGAIKQERLAQAASDDGFMDQLNRAHQRLTKYLTARTWFQQKYGKFDSPKIAYFSMEFGLTECLTIYSGGLGILAGDHLKSASELGLPLVGVGLLYQQGYFQQYLNNDGWQQEIYPNNDFYNLPIELQTDQNGFPILVETAFPGRTVYCRIWRVQVGRVSLYLLDSNTPENSNADRRITNQLYGGDNEMRIKQEMLLGIGGMRALRKLDIHAHVCHMNEGHAALMALERIRHRKKKDNLTTAEALEVVKAGTIFTTHTPVPAGIDIFDKQLILKYVKPILEDSEIGEDEFLALGRRNPQDYNEPFNMALLAIRTTAHANGVSRLHGEVSRRMWQSIWPEVPLEEIPIGYITNGIHTHSWTSKEMCDLLLRYLGPNWLRNTSDESNWAGAERIPDVELWRVHERRRERLVAFARNRLAEQFKRRGASTKEIDAAREVLNPDALTIGFARRFATYKRATLLLRDEKRLKKLLSNPDRPVQFVFAGKAHPRDDGGKELIKRLIHFAREEGVHDHIVFIENYDMNVARYLVEGVDVWLNTPCRPMEASGTSGMKVIPNGGLNLSVLDGWWCEGYSPDVGWAIGAGEDYDDPDYRDEVESKGLYDVLENNIIPLFYDRQKDGLPRNWIAMMKHSLMKLGHKFSTDRMVRRYTEEFYMRAYNNWQKLSGDKFHLAKTLSEWKQHIKAHWHEVRIGCTDIEKKEAEVGMALRVRIEMNLGSLSPDDVAVQVYSGPLDADGEICESTVEAAKYLGITEGNVYEYEAYIPCDESGLFGYSVRVLPYHPDMYDQFGLEMMRWIEQREIHKRDSAPAIISRKEMAGSI